MNKFLKASNKVFLFDLNKVHDICPALQRYNKEDGDPYNIKFVIIKKK